MATERERRREERRKRFEKAMQERARATGTKARAPTKVPPFDLHKFVELEKLRSKATLHSVLYAALLTTALVLGGRALGSAGAGALAALALMLSLRFYLRFAWDVDVAELGRPTSVLGVFFAYFVTCVMVSFLLSNPPVFDDLAPEVHCCRFQGPDGTGGWQALDPLAPSLNASQGSARVEAFVFDNAGVERVTMSVLTPGGAWQNGTQMVPRGDGAYHAVLDNLTAGGYTVLVTARDAAGHEAAGRADPSLRVNSA